MTLRIEYQILRNFGLAGHFIAFELCKAGFSLRKVKNLLKEDGYYAESGWFRSRKKLTVSEKRVSTSSYHGIHIAYVLEDEKVRLDLLVHTIDWELEKIVK